MIFNRTLRTVSLIALCSFSLAACSHHSDIEADTSLTAAAGATTARATSAALADLKNRHNAYEKHLVILAALEGSSKQAEQSRSLISDSLQSVTRSFDARRMFLRDLTTAYTEFGRLNSSGAEDAFAASAARLSGSFQQYGVSLGKPGIVSKAVGRLTAIAGKAYAGKKIQQANNALGDTVAEAATLIRTERALYGALQQEFIRTESDATLAMWRNGLLSSSALAGIAPVLPGFIPAEEGAWTISACNGNRNCAVRRITQMLASRETNARIKREEEALKAIAAAFSALKNAHSDITDGRPVEGYKLAKAVHALGDYADITVDDSDLTPAGGATHGGKKGLTERIRARFN